VLKYKDNLLRIKKFKMLKKYREAKMEQLKMMAKVRESYAMFIVIYKSSIKGNKIYIKIGNRVEVMERLMGFLILFSCNLK